MKYRVQTHSYAGLVSGVTMVVVQMTTIEAPTGQSGNLSIVVPQATADLHPVGSEWTLQLTAA